MGNYCIRYVNSFNYQLAHYQLHSIIGAFRFPHIQPAMDGCCICGPSGFTLVAFCRVCSNPGSVIPHTLHKLRLRCLNGKKAIAAIPNAVEQCTSLYIAQRQVFLTKILLLINTTDVLVRSELASLSILGHEFFAVFRHGWRG